MLDTRLPETPAPDPEAPRNELARASQVDGYVELCGAPDTSGWLVAGWTRRGWRERTSGVVTLRFPGGAVTGDVTTCFFGRGDLRRGAIGFLLFLHGDTALSGDVQHLTIRLADEVLQLAPVRAALPSSPDTLREEAARLASEIGSLQVRSMLQPWLDPPRFLGRDTLTPLGRPVAGTLEAAFHSASDAVVLLGWLDDPAGIVATLHLRCGDRAVELTDRNWLRLPRRDVANDAGPDRGFLAYCPGLRTSDAPVALQVTFTDGEIAFLPAPEPTRSGLAALQQVLGALQLHPGRLARAMPMVVGPAIEALNTGWLARRPGVQDLCFGRPPGAVRCSVVICLAGVVDELEWLLSLLSQAEHPDIEWLFVLDGPALAAEVERRAETCPARFGLPFRLLLLDRTIGHTACCNIAAALATGQHLAFLSAAALPENPDWLERLLATLDANPGLGAIGGRMSDAPMQEVTAVNAACLAMSRDLFIGMAGFDEAFALPGDATTDLCRRLRRDGLGCAVHDDVPLTLLDRSPRPVPLWRRNLALYDAWQLRRRWPEAAG